MASIRERSWLSSASRKPHDSGARLSKHSSPRGIVSKRRDDVYLSERTRGLLKVKCEEFVIVGSTDPKSSRRYFGSLLIALLADTAEPIFAPLECCFGTSREVPGYRAVCSSY